MTLDGCLELGFDQSEQDGRYVHVRCSQCEALVINGTPTHEAGCRNARLAREEEDDAEYARDACDCSCSHGGNALFCECHQPR